MVLRRARGYQDIDGLTGSSRTELPDPDSGVTQEIEMASVSVVPDGNFIKPYIINCNQDAYNIVDTYTVTQAVNALGFGWFQVKLSLWTGLCWMADSMEMTILSILSPALHCHWHISRYINTTNMEDFLIHLFIFYCRYQQALTTTVVFLGMMLSSTFWGNLSDRYGRKHVILLF